MIVAAVVLGAGTARAFICSRAELPEEGVGASLSWSSRTIPYILYFEGTTDIAGDEEFGVIRKSFGTWNDLTPCEGDIGSDITFVEAAGYSHTDQVGYDVARPEAHENLIIFRDENWPAGGELLLALTTVSYDATTGEIFDADIEFNAAGFPFGIDGSEDAMDLENAATHEIGHMLGLGHSDVASATMEATADLGDTEKRSLECDDRASVVFKYPAGAPNGYCEPTPDCGYCAPPDDAPVTAAPEQTDEPKATDDAGGCATTSATSALGGLTAVLMLFLHLARCWRRRPRRAAALSTACSACSGNTSAPAKITAAGPTATPSGSSRTTRSRSPAGGVAATRCACGSARAPCCAA